MNKFIHIGFPKNISTSLQRDYFSKHPSIFHLGVGVDSNIGFYNTLVENTCEVYLKTCKYYKYKEKEAMIVKGFKKLFADIDSKYQITGISFEHFSFSFAYDSISTQEKAERLYGIFGDNTKIIIIVRNQFDLIKSLYREYVRNGFAFDFETFIYLSYKYQDRNYLYDFRYDLVYNTYTKLFGKDNVNLFFFEDYIDENKQLILNNQTIKIVDDLNASLGIENVQLELEHFNEALPLNKVALNASKNADICHNFGNHLFEIAEKHRIKSYVKEELGLNESEREIYKDVLSKRMIINEIINSSDFKSITFEANQDIVSSIKSFYEKGNKVLQEIIHIGLPQSYHNLKL
jgi:hypothetical protein